MKNSKGIGLLEILIAITIAGFGGIYLVRSFVQSQGFFLTEQAKINQGLNINDASTQINESIRSASAIAATNLVGTPTYSSDTDTLVLELPSIDVSGNVINQTFDYIIVTLEGSNPQRLRKKLFPAAASARKAEDRVLATNVSLLNISYKDQNGLSVSPSAASKVNYIINLSEKAGYGDKSSSASSELNLRNN